MADDRVGFGQDIINVDTYNAKCPSCGSTMVFDPDTQSLKCEHCGTTGEINKNFEVVEHDIERGFDEAQKWSPDEQVTYKCSNCGAVVVLSIDEEASVCPFCKATHIAKEDAFEGIRPHMVIPFQFGRDKAVEYSKKWARSRLFAPKKFKKSIEVEEMNGIYEPCFTFDSMTFSTYNGRVGDRKTRVVGSGKNRRTVTYIDYRYVNGTHSAFFDDVMIASNKNFTQKDVNNLSPFKRECACVYEKQYLSGFMADSYQKSLQDCWGDAKKNIDSQVRGQIKNKLHCDVIDYLNVATTHTNVTFKYILVPVYSLVYRFKKKNYTVKVNGSTGKVKGKTPISAIRVVIAVLLGLGLSALLCWLFANYL